MHNLLRFAGIALIAFPFSAHAIDGCGPKQVCTYKGALKAGQACPASFCQDSAYQSGAAAAGNGGVLRVVNKLNATKDSPGVNESGSPAPSPVNSAATTWVDPPAKASGQWKDPPPRAARRDARALPTFATIQVELQRCRGLKLPYADQSADCRRALDLDALGFQNGAGGLEKFCQNVAGGDEAAMGRCRQAPSLEEVTVESVLRKIQRAKLGSLERSCRDKHGEDQEALRRCVGARAMVARVTPGLKRAGPVVDPRLSDSVEMLPPQNQDAR